MHSRHENKQRKKRLCMYVDEFFKKRKRDFSLRVLRIAMLCTVETAGMNRESKPLQAKDGWSWAR